MWTPTRLRQQPLSRRALAGLRGPDTNSPDAGASLEAEFTFTRAELGPVRQRIRDALGSPSVALDSPARLQESLVALIGAIDSEAAVTVRRSPAALLTPEYWRIQVRGIDPDALATLSTLLRNVA